MHITFKMLTTDGEEKIPEARQKLITKEKRIREHLSFDLMQTKAQCCDMFEVLKGKKVFNPEFHLQ